MSDPEKRAAQEALRARWSMVFVGRGPSATGPGPGWTLGPSLFLRCGACDYFIPAASNESDACYCGALYKDADSGRLGSRLGDDAIKVYRAEPKGTGRVPPTAT
jgi:hypothetical protein